MTTVLDVPLSLAVEARATFYILAATFPFVLLVISLRAILEAAQRFDLINLIRAPSASAVFLIPAVAAPLGLGLPGIMLLLLIVRMATCWVTARAVRRALPFFTWTIPTDWRLIRPLISYGK